MNSRIRIVCRSCEYEYYAYLQSDMHNVDSLDCPRCFAQMDDQMKETVMRIAGSVSDLNTDFVKHHLSDSKESLFLVSFDGIQGPLQTD